MYTTPNVNRYEIDAELAHRQSQIRNDHGPHRQPLRRLSLPKLPGLPSLPRVLFRHSSLSA
jgi:hypothetical protein